MKMKTLFSTVLLLMSSLAWADQGCQPIKTLQARNAPNGKVVGKISKNTGVILFETKTDHKGRKWGNVIYGKYNKEVGFEVQAEGWVLKSNLRCN